LVTTNSACTRKTASPIRLCLVFVRSKGGRDFHGGVLLLSCGGCPVAASATCHTFIAGCLSKPTMSAHASLVELLPLHLCWQAAAEGRVPLSHRNPLLPGRWREGSEGIGACGPSDIENLLDHQLRPASLLDARIPAGPRLASTSLPTADAPSQPPRGSPDLAEEEIMICTQRLSGRPLTGLHVINAPVYWSANGNGGSSAAQETSGQRRPGRRRLRYCVGQTIAGRIFSTGWGL
jgi:hypothetical protein